MKVGVFDSGVGGLSVANSVKEALPDVEVLYREDKENIPYGSKSPEQLLDLVEPILKDMAAQGCSVIVVACNTVSTTIIQELRELISVPLVGVEPMVKPAAEQTKSKIIAVCATPTTLASNRYNELKQLYAEGVTVIEPDCSDWSSMIEANDVDYALIEEQIIDVCEQGADVIVLGCTHYHWIEEEIQRIAVRFDTQVMQPEPAVIEQLKTVLAQLS